MLGLDSNVWGSVFGLFRIDDTATYGPPTWRSRSAYSFSAPTARMIPGDAAAVAPAEPAPADPHPAATTAAHASVAQSRPGWRARRSPGPAACRERLMCPDRSWDSVPVQERPATGR